MSDLKALLERADRAVADVPLPARGLEGLERRCDRKRRNHRVAAGVLGIAVFALPAIGFVRLVGSERGPAVGPATSPSPTASPSPVTPPSTPFTERFDSPHHVAEGEGCHQRGDDGHHHHHRIDRLTENAK